VEEEEAGGGGWRGRRMPAVHPQPAFGDRTHQDRRAPDWEVLQFWRIAPCRVELRIGRPRWSISALAALAPGTPRSSWRWKGGGRVGTASPRARPKPWGSKIGNCLRGLGLGAGVAVRLPAPRACRRRAPAVRLSAPRAGAHPELVGGARALRSRSAPPYA